VPCYVPR